MTSRSIIAILFLLLTQNLFASPNHNHNESAEYKSQKKAQLAQEKWDSVDLTSLLSQPAAETSAKSKAIELAMSEAKWNKALNSQSAFLTQAIQKTSSELFGQEGSRLKNFKMLVFPVVSDQNERNNLPQDSFFGRPIEFTFRVKWQKDCSQMTEESIDDGRYEPKRYFQSALELRGKICTVLRVFPTHAPSVLTKDEVKEIALYLDEDFKSYGYDVIQHVNRNAKQDRITRFPFGGAAPTMSSGLFLFPIDIPSLALVSIQGLKPLQQKSLVPQDTYVRNKISKLIYSKEAAHQSVNLDRLCGSQKQVNLAYRDQLGSAVHMSWCNGDQWPRTVLNKRFFAILKKAQ